jgi:hypothetical protein
MRGRGADLAAHQERRQHQQRQRAEFGDGRQSGKERPEPDADDVGDPGNHDRTGGQVIGAARIKRRVVAHHAQEVLAEHRRDAAERGGADQHQLRPAVKEAERPSPAFTQVDIHPAGLGHRRREFGERQRAA